MADLKNSETGQIVEGVDRETFLREISDPHSWVDLIETLVHRAEAFIEPVVEKVESLLGMTQFGRPIELLPAATIEIPDDAPVIEPVIPPTAEPAPAEPITTEPQA